MKEHDIVKISGIFRGTIVHTYESEEKDRVYEVEFPHTVKHVYEKDFIKEDEKHNNK